MPTTDAKAIDIITRAMKMAGIAASGEAPSPEDSADGLEILNGMIDAWGTDRLFIYNVTIASYPLISGQQDYTIGPTGANFTAPRPSTIENANIVITTNSPETRIPLYLMDDDDWMDIRVRQIGPTLPSALYYSRDYPNGTLRLYPLPTTGLSLEIETWTQLSQFPDLTTVFSFPPGYYEAVYQNLALRFCTPEYGIDQAPASIAVLAQDSRARIESLNCTPPSQMTCDAGVGPVRHMPVFWIKDVSRVWYR